MAELVTWERQPIALRVHGEEGDYLVPPIVFDGDENLLMGGEVLEAIVQSGTAIDHPVITGATAADLAQLEQKLAHVSASLGLPLRTV